MYVCGTLEEGYPGKAESGLGYLWGDLMLDNRDTDAPPAPSPHTHVHAPTHTPQHTALLGGLCQARGHCRISQGCRGSLRGWSDVFVLPSSHSPRCCPVLNFWVASVWPCGWGGGGRRWRGDAPCASNWTSWIVNMVRAVGAGGCLPVCAA